MPGGPTYTLMQRLSRHQAREGLVSHRPEVRFCSVWLPQCSFPSIDFVACHSHRDETNKEKPGCLARCSMRHDPNGRFALASLCHPCPTRNKYNNGVGR